jgi:hypothetical protein
VGQKYRAGQKEACREEMRQAWYRSTYAQSCLEFVSGVGVSVSVIAIAECSVCEMAKCTVSGMSGCEWNDTCMFFGLNGMQLVCLCAHMQLNIVGEDSPPKTLMHVDLTCDI